MPFLNENAKNALVTIFANGRQSWIKRVLNDPKDISCADRYQYDMTNYVMQCNQKFYWLIVQYKRIKALHDLNWHFLISTTAVHDKDSSGDEIANVNFYAVRQEATRIRRNNAK